MSFMLYNHISSMKWNFESTNKITAHTYSSSHVRWQFTHVEQKQPQNFKQQHGRLAPATSIGTFFINFCQQLKNCFESSFQRFSTNINSTTDSYNSWLIVSLGLRSKILNPRYFLKHAFWRKSLTINKNHY